MIYIKDDIQITVNSKFIYCSEIYKIWNNGAALIEEKYYSSKEPLKFKKNNIVRKKDYLLQRFFTLQYAPESFLIKNNFKLKSNV